MEIPNLETLSKIAYSYYPRGLEEYEEGYDDTDENIMLNQKINVARKKTQEWGNFLSALNAMGFVTEDLSFFWKDRCLTCKFYGKDNHAQYSIICLSMIIPSFIFYHNKQTPTGFVAELDLTPLFIYEKEKIIKNLTFYFGGLFEFPYDLAILELKDVSYGNNGRTKKIEKLTGFPAIDEFTFFNAFFSDMYFFG